MFTASKCYALNLNYNCTCMHMVISCIVVVFRMCDSTDPARAAELYITASEMNVVRSHSQLLETNLPKNISCTEKRSIVMFIMSWAWVEQRKKSESPKGFKPIMTSQTLSECSNHWATKTSQWVRPFSRFIMTCVLHTAMISDVESILFGDKWRKMVDFQLSSELRKM